MNTIKKIMLGFLCIITMYGIVFYIVQFFNKPSVLIIVNNDVHQPLLPEVQENNQEDNKDHSVVVQSRCQIDNDNEYEMEDTATDEVQDVINSDELIVLKTVQPVVLSPKDSFVTIEFHHADKLDDKFQQAFDLLIGHDIDKLLDLIAQSNNNILSTDSCKTCAIDAILKKVSKHKKLSEQELVSLQHIIANLYKFINTMQKLSNTSILAPEQIIALKNLNTSQVSQNNLIMQARQATTLAALQSLKNIDMVERHG